MIERFKKNYAIFLLILLIMFHAINNYNWLRLDTQPPEWEDQISYLIRSLWIYDAIGSLSIDKLVSSTSDIRPPLVSLLATPAYFIAGTSLDVAIMTNILYIIIIIFSIHGITNKISNKKEIGLLSAFIISTFPMIFGMSRQFLIDLPLTAAVSLSVYILLYTEHFKNRTYSILFGVSMGFGMLVKPTYPIFIFFPFLYLIKDDIKILKMLLLPKRFYFELKQRKSILNISLAVLVAIVLASIWYIPNLNNIYFYYALTKEKASPVINLQPVLYYPIGTINYLISFIYFFIFIILVILTIFNRNIFNFKYLFNYLELDETMIFILWVVTPYIIFTFFLHYSLKEFRFLLPSTPAIAIATALMVDKIRNNKAKLMIVILIVLVGSTQFFIMTYGIKALPEEISLNTTLQKPLNKVVLFSQEPRWEYPGYWEEGWTYPPKKVNWRINDIMTIISEDSVKINPKIVIIPNTERFHLGTFWYYQILYNKTNMIFYRFKDLQSNEDIENYDYIIVKDYNNCGVSTICEAINRSYSIFLDYSYNFIIIKNMTLPDGSKVFIYRRNILFANGWYGIENWKGIKTQWISNTIASGINL